MQWSKLKSKVKSFICPALRDRIDFHLTSYRKSHDGADKIWITIDGERVFSCKHYVEARVMAEAFYEGWRGEQIKDFLKVREVHGPGDFGNAMRAYLEMPVNESLKSSNPFIKAFALVDRRVGKRTIEKIEVSDTEHTLVKEFYNLRRRTAQT